MSSFRFSPARVYVLTATLFTLLVSPSLSADYSTAVSTRVRPVSPLTTGLNLSYGQLLLRNYTWDGETFAKPGHALTLEVEWLPFADLWGKPAIGSSFGYYLIGKEDTSPARLLHLFPIGLFASYRFDYMRHQWLVPFVKAGGSVLFAQRSTGGRIQSEWHWDYGAGLELSLGAIDPYSARNLDFRTGINDFFLTIEYVKSVPMQGGQALDLAHEEFRFGIRFEI